MLKKKKDIYLRPNNNNNNKTFEVLIRTLHVFNFNV